MQIALLTSDQQEHLQSLAAQLPLVLLSDKPGSSEDVWQGLNLGAAEVLERPLSLLKLRNIWQHVVRKVRIQGLVLCRCTFQPW